jgi:hypothetical protein
MVIGSSEHFETSLSPDECAQRMRQALQSFSPGSYVEPSHFGISKRGRTMIRMVGTLELADRGSTVRYRIEFKRSTLLALAFSLLAAIPIFVAWSLLGYSLIPLALLLTGCVVVVALLNLLVSEWQARWLRNKVEVTLGSRPIAR